MCVCVCVCVCACTCVCVSCSVMFNSSTLCNPMNCHQAALFMKFSWQQYWNRLPFPSLRDLPNSGIKSHLLCLLRWQADSLPLSHQGSLLQTFLKFFALGTMEMEKRNW